MKEENLKHLSKLQSRNIIFMIIALLLSGMNIFYFKNSPTLSAAMIIFLVSVTNYSVIKGVCLAEQSGKTADNSDSLISIIAIIMLLIQMFFIR